MVLRQKRSSPNWKFDYYCTTEKKKITCLFARRRRDIPAIPYSTSALLFFSEKCRAQKIDKRVEKKFVSESEQTNL